MPEIKNNFTGSKMNKDLDSRLIPNNEYRNALNLQINKSEGSDVGTLQNILGNSSVADYRALTNITDLQCIGVYADDATNDLYLFLTNNTLANYNISASNFIYVYNSLNSSNTLLVSGPFLNFSILNPVLGINLIEKLLFWTDNRNQPRRINIEKASTSQTYYTIEDQISVAKLTPVSPIDLFKLTTLTKAVLLTGSVTVGTVTLTSGIYTATVEVSGLVSANKLGVGSTVTFITTGPPEVTSKATVTSVVLSIDGYVTFFSISSTTLFTTGSKTNLYNTTVDQYETSMYDVVSLTLPDNTTVNPYLNTAYPGDSTFLADKFVRFSYRYIFEDGEYSLMAPFTQIAFIPKQDGYFTYTSGVIPVDDEANAYRSTVVDFMENKVNNIFLQIPLPSAANQVYPTYKISAIEILYKESESLSASVIDVILVKEAVDAFWNSSNSVYSYDYQSKKPFKTLPTNDLIRVYDKTPIKALGQEVAGNRIIYSNYQDKFYYPKTIDFNVGFSTKSMFGADSIYSKSDGTPIGSSIKEYPNHSLKQNRNYQVGIILCDKFGRQSGVILSSATTENASLGAGSLYVPYTDAGENSALSQWPGYSLKVGFDAPIPSNKNASTGWPGLYNGNSASSSYNPLGWYSYKIVVKQTEQEYYNVYLPGVMAAYPSSPTLEIGRTSHASLINDNINKVPRDLIEIGPTQVQFASSVILFPRVNNITIAPYNKQFYPGNTNCIVSTIATNNSLFYPNGTATDIPAAGIDNFYSYLSNPLIARISTPNKVGVTADNSIEVLQHLAIFETAPVESKLDIYWETSTVGLLSELNEAIEAGADPDQIILLNNWNFELYESYNAGVDVTGSFAFIGADTNKKIPSTFTLLATDGDGNIVSSKFEMYLFDAPNKEYKIRTTAGSYFFYSDSGTLNNFTFVISTTQDGLAPRSFPNLGTITNIEPIFTTPGDATVPLVLTPKFGTTEIYTFVTNNGANLGNTEEHYTNGLVITKSGTGSEMFSLTSTTLGSSTLIAPGNLTGVFSFDIIVTDAGGLFYTLPIKISLINPSGIIFNPSETCFYTNGTIESISNFIEGTVEVIGNDATFQTKVTNGAGSSASLLFYLYVLGVQYGFSEASSISTEGTFISNVPAGVYDYRIDYSLTQAVAGSQGITGCCVESYQAP